MLLFEDHQKNISEMPISCQFKKFNFGFFSAFHLCLSNNNSKCNYSHFFQSFLLPSFYNITHKAAREVSKLSNRNCPFPFWPITYNSPISIQSITPINTVLFPKLFIHPSLNREFIIVADFYSHNF
jgi:hypothetical protein